MVFPAIWNANPAFYSSNAFVTGVNNSGGGDVLLNDVTSSVMKFQDNPIFPTGRDPSAVFDNTSKQFTAPSTTNVYMTIKLSLYNDSGTDSTVTVKLYNNTDATDVVIFSSFTVSSTTSSSAPLLWQTNYTLSATSGKAYELRAYLGVGDTNLVYYVENGSYPACLWYAYW
jgi:hypothetical protein